MAGFLLPLIASGIGAGVSTLANELSAKPEEERQRRERAALIAAGEKPVSMTDAIGGLQKAPSTFNAALSGGGRGLEFAMNNPDLNLFQASEAVDTGLPTLEEPSMSVPETQELSLNPNIQKLAVDPRLGGVNSFNAFLANSQKLRRGNYND